MLRAYEGGSLWPPAQRGRKPDERQLAKIRFRNDNSGTVPAWGVMRMTGASQTSGGSWYVTTNKPNTTVQSVYLVNSGRDVESGKYGWATYLWHSNYVLFDTASTPAYGETWGPQNAAWTVKKNNDGFFVIGGNAGSGSTSRTLAIQKTGQLKAGGYRNPTSKTYTSGGADKEIEWATFNTYSASIFTVDPASPKTKLYLPPGRYLSWLTFSVTATSDARINVYLTTDGTAVTGQNTALIDIVGGAGTTQINHMGFAYVDTDGTYLLAKMGVVTSDVSLGTYGAWTVQQTG